VPEVHKSKGTGHEPVPVFRPGLLAMAAYEPTNP